MCLIGLNVNRPSALAVLSPWRSAAYPWAYSCATIDMTSTGNASRKSPSWPTEMPYRLDS